MASKGSHSTENDVISLQKREYIRQTLLKYLNSHTVKKYEVISYTDSEHADTDDKNLRGVMVLASDDRKRIIPDPHYKDEHMICNPSPQRTIYTLWVSTNDNGIRFLYGWRSGVRDYIIAPYFEPPVRNYDVFCSYSLEVTQAVNSQDPTAFEKDLEQLANRSNDQKGFNNDMYLWSTDSKDGVIVYANFIVSKLNNGETWCWEAKGHVRLTNNPSDKAHLKFLQY